MSKIISNAEQREKIKQLAMPVFAAVEKLLWVIKANGDHAVYDNIQKHILELNKAMFAYRGHVPSWDLEKIQESLNNLISSIPRISRKDVPYEDLKVYLANVNKPVPTQVEKVETFFDRVKQAIGLGGEQR